MQHRLGGLLGYAIRATDGDLGKVHEFYFDDATWTIRYMVVETGKWLSGRRVLVSPVALGKPDWESRTFSVKLTCDQVRNSPDIDAERPVYRQHEVELHEYYQWPRYWEGGYGGTFGITPFPLLEKALVREPPESAGMDDPHLRSTHHVMGFHVRATDGEIGHLADFIVDDEKWSLQHLVVDTGNWLPGKEVLIPFKGISGVNWADASVYLDRSRESVKNGPAYDPLKTMLPDYQDTLSTVRQ